MNSPKFKDARTYSVHGLLAAGSRFSDDYGPEDAVEHYLELHPDADRAQVQAELDAEMREHGM